VIDADWVQERVGREGTELSNQGRGKGCCCSGARGVYVDFSTGFYAEDLTKQRGRIRE
jgi:hypothetical protein